MWATIKEMATSKKFIVMVGGLLVAGGSALTGQLEVTSALQAGLVLVLTYLGVQGIADFGKSSAKITSAKITTDTTTTDTK